MKRASPQLPLLPVPAQLCTAQATAEVQTLFTRMAAGYGQETLSGQHRTIHQPDFGEADYIQSVTGRRPLILGADLLPFSRSWVERETAPEGLIPDCLEAARQGHIISLMWHWNASADLYNRVLPLWRWPNRDARWYKGFYTRATEFNLAAALEPGTEAHQLLLADVDAVAGLLGQFAAAGVPVLWRPLHEAEGGWFWWGAQGATPFKALWRLIYERLTLHHGLRNLIWVYTTTHRPNIAWYPGDDVVDIVAADVYPRLPWQGYEAVWRRLLPHYNGRKMLALAETGGVPDVPRMHAAGTPWLYFMAWTENLGPRSSSRARLLKTYHADCTVSA